MRAAPLLDAESRRVLKGYMASKPEWGCNGAFTLRSPVDHKPLMVVASDGGGWDHVSVSRKDRCPTWQEMEYVRDLFFQPDETVVQFSPPRDERINVHENCLHMWRNQAEAVALPLSWMV